LAPTQLEAAVGNTLDGDKLGVMLAAIAAHADTLACVPVCAWSGCP
jgi:hypothetical protein